MEQFSSRISALNILAFLVFILFSLSPLADFFSSLSRYQGIGQFDRLSLIVRTLMIISAVLYLFIFDGKARLSLLLLFFYGAFVSAVFGIYTGRYNAIIENIILLAKFFSVFVLYRFFLCVLIENEARYRTLLYIGSFVVASYVFAIIFGVVFSVEQFVYYDGGRWGFKGIALAGNEVSALLLGSLVWALFLFSGVGRYVFLVLIFFACIFSGTKVASFGSIVFFIGCFLFYFKGRGKRAVIKIMPFLFVPFIFSFAFIDSVYDVLLSNFNYFEYQFYHHAGGSYLTTILSGRDLKLMEIFRDIEDGALWVSFFGGFSVSSFSSELDFFDLYLLIGPVGFILYIYFWVRMWRVGSDIPINKRLMLLYCMWIILGVAFFAGHVFYSVLFSTIIALALSLIKFKYCKESFCVRNEGF